MSLCIQCIPMPVHFEILHNADAEFIIFLNILFLSILFDKRIMIDIINALRIRYL